MDKEQLSKDIQKLKAKISDIEEKLNEPEQFELKYERRNTYMLYSASVNRGIKDGEIPEYLEHGRYRVTEEYANKSLERNKRANRLEALVEQVSIELGMIDWEADWSDSSRLKWYVFYKHGENKWSWSHNITLNTAETVYMPIEVAERVCEILNNKEYTL